MAKMIGLDEHHIKYEHAAKCLNPKCDNPINIIWKENLLLVKKPEPKVENKAINGEEHVENGVNCEKINGEMSEGVRCDECGTKFSEERIEMFVKSMEFSEVHLSNMKETSVAYLKADVDICKFCLERQEGVLHPLNVLYAQTLDNAFDALIQVQLWEMACVYAEKLLPCFRFYYGNYHPLVGLLHMKYGKILLYKMDLKGALHQFKCAEKIIKITHGERHPLYREHLLPAIDQAIIESS